MSLILIGTKRFRRLRALSTETQCPPCLLLVIYYYLRTRRWLTYFFIPVLPLSITHELVCPICTNSIKLSAVEARSARHGELKLKSQGKDHPLNDFQGH